MSAMITSLKNNNGLLRKRSKDFFNRKSTKLKRKYKKHLRISPELSEKELLNLRKKLKLERKINDIKQLIILSFIICGIIALLVHFL